MKKLLASLALAIAAFGMVGGTASAQAQPVTRLPQLNAKQVEARLERIGCVPSTPSGQIGIAVVVLACRFSVLVRTVVGPLHFDGTPDTLRWVRTSEEALIEQYFTTDTPLPGLPANEPISMIQYNFDKSLGYKPGPLKVNVVVWADDEAAKVERAIGPAANVSVM
jgi:hypothetical protein